MLDLIKRLRDHGLAVMVISHNLNDVFEVADRIAVLYLGRMVAEGPAADFDRQSVVEYMTTGTANGPTSPPRPPMARAEIDGQNREAPVTADPARPRPGRRAPGRPT